MVATMKYTLAAACLGAMLGVAVIGQSEAERDAAKHGVVMVRTQLPGGSAIGAGLVVALTPKEVYVATANHLLRRGGVASSIQLQFYSRPGEWFDARLLDLRDPELDLGAVVVPLPPTINATTLRTVAAAASQLRRGMDVYPLGFPRERPWNMPVAADKVASTNTSRVFFQSQYVQPGNSGGALLDSCGRTVGMVTATEPPEAEAVRIESVLDAVRMWKLPAPLSLTTTSAACGGSGPQEASRPVPVPPQAPATCEVTLNSTPSAADVYIDDTRTGTTPRVVALRRGQRYDLLIEKEGYQSVDRQIDCASDVVRVTLEADTTSIDLVYAGDLFACGLQLQVAIGGRTAIPTSNFFTMEDVPLGRHNYNITGQITCPLVGACTARGQGTIDVEEDATFNFVWSSTGIGQCQVTLVKQ